MQKVPFSNGWAFVQDPGWPAPDDDDSYVSFEEAPASPDPSTGDTSCYEITSSVETSGLPTPPPPAGPPIPIQIEEASVDPQPRRGPQRVAKMSTGGVKKN